MKHIIILILSLWIWTGCSGEGTGTNDVALNKVAAVEVAAQEWNIRIIAEDTTNNMKTAGAQLGQLSIENAQSEHSLKGLAPFTASFLDVVFKNPTGLAVGEYKSDFHTTTSSDGWEFTVKSSDSSADMILSWRGLYVLSPYIDEQGRERYHEYRSMTNPLLSYMTLIDVSTNTEIPTLLNGTVNEYVFNMDGATERTFRWVLHSNVVPAPAPLNSTMKYSKQMKSLEIKALRKDAKSTPTKLKIKRVKALDMTKPPIFKVLAR
ncbi:MAG TPA: hypothetical protein ENJ34_00095 [Epsilonproteobacteria bacterium]|nr:hypothetical protein [Campylobacterota bacterium]